MLMYPHCLDESFSNRVRQAIFVFGSNLEGIHGKGAALYAKDFKGMQPGVGEGLSGSSYAIPTKKNPYETRDLNAIQSSVKNFIDFARNHIDLDFYVTRVGCGLAGFADDQIAPFFMSAPQNCFLPGVWERRRTPNLMRLVIAGSRGLDNRDWMLSRIEAIMANQRDIKAVEVICGGANGADHIGYLWGQKRDLVVRGFKAEWDKFGRRAGYMRNAEMAWVGTHLIAFMSSDNKTPGTSAMINLAKESGLAVRVVDCLDMKIEPDRGLSPLQ